MSLTQITRDNQIKPGSAYNWVTNDSSGKMSQTSVTASKAVATDSNGLPTASATTAAQLAYLQGLTSLTVGDIINVSSGGNLQDAGIASSNLFLADGTVSATGNLNVGGHKITNMADPTSAQDAATKNYVDNLVNGVTWKTSVQAATTTALASNTYANGTAGVGATLTATANAALVVDGYTVSTNDRILVKNEATTSHNGIYVVTQTGSGSLPYILTRSLDMDTPAEVPTATVLVEEGTANADTGWVCTTQPPVTIGTTAITFVLFGTVNTYSAGSGLDLTGTVFSISTDNSLTANAGNSNPSLQVKESPTGAITTTGSGIAVSVDGSTIDISANAIEVKAGGITNTQVSATAAIAYSKLSLTNSIVNADINSSAAIAYSKLNLSGSIVNSDINSSAAIAFSKLASLPSADILLGNGSNVATATAMTGDVSITNTGVTSISSGLSTHFVTREVPSGSINGSNVTFTLANTPTAGTECVFLNGLLQNVGGGNDYTISGATITFNTAPESGSVILVNYQK